MGDVAFEGQDRIQSNDGSTTIGITQRQVKLTKPDVPAAEATAADLILNDQQNVFKIVATDVIAFPATPGATSGDQSSMEYDIDTGVEATGPLIAQVFTQTGDAANQLPYIASIPGPTFGGYIAYRFAVTSYVSVVTDTVHILIESTNFVASMLPAISMRWYILQETSGAV